MQPLYGRASIAGQARASLERALAGQGRPLVFTGEPGIGKSALAEYVAAEAAARQVAVAWGRCWEAGGAPPYWPWNQIFRALGMDEDPFAGTLSAVASGAAETRFAAFDRAVRALKARATHTPLALLLDDLHAADTPSLLLLLLLARELRGSRILVVGAYRDAEARLSPERAALLAKIARESEVLPLQRLGIDDVTLWLHETGGLGEATELYRLTEGHPLFVVEMLRLGNQCGQATASLGAMLDEHLSRLSPRTRALLESAAVLGRDFRERELVAVTIEDPDLVHQDLDQALATSVVQPGNEPGSFRFAHVLLRDRIYVELLPSARAALHFRAATTLLAQEPPALTSAVHHLFEGQSAVAPGRVAEVALAAAEASLSRLAFEDAEQLARRALRLPRPTPMAAALECRLRLVLGEALIRLGESATGKAEAAEAAELAERTGNPDLLARAALIYATELASGIIDPPMNALLRRALAQLGEADSPLHARLLARLAAGLTPPVGPESVSEILALMRAATEMARRMGDMHTLLFVLQFGATVGLLVPEQERISFMQETVQLATALDQRLVLLHALPSYITALIAVGRRADAEALLPRYEEVIAESRQPAHRVQWHLVLALFSALRGDFDEADRLAEEARMTAERGGSAAGLRNWISHLLSIALLRKRPELMRADAHSLVAHFEGMWGGGSFVAWTLIGRGRREEAAARLHQVDVSALHIPPANLMDLLGAAEVCVLLADVELGATVYPRLQRAADRMFWNLGAGTILGPTARTLGDLALLIDKTADAVRYYDEAMAFCERMEAPLLVEQCRQSRDAAISRGAVGRTSLAVAASQSEPRLRLRREGDLWIVTTADNRFHLKQAKGLVYLNYLIDQPGRQIHVLELTGVEHSVGDAGPVLDARAKQEYRRRLDDLHDQLHEAERFSDAGRAARIEAEIGAIADQLAGAVGLGGRDRRAASAVERTRVNVQRCLKDVIERICALDPALGRYLSATVKSGTYCTYQPI